MVKTTILRRMGLLSECTSKTRRTLHVAPNHEKLTGWPIAIYGSTSMGKGIESDSQDYQRDLLRLFKRLLINIPLDESSHRRFAQ